MSSPTFTLVNEYAGTPRIYHLDLYRLNSAREAAELGYEELFAPEGAVTFVEWAGRALRMDPEEPQVLYNVACVFAQQGEPERAIECLEKSITHGWGQKEWMENDPDLASLRNHPRFQALLKLTGGAGRTSA